MVLVWLGADSIICDDMIMYEDITMMSSWRLLSLPIQAAERM
jgi:hypothetical protein